MNKGKIKILAMIALILQATAVAAGLGIVVMQKTLVTALMTQMSDSVKPVIPVTLFFTYAVTFVLPGLSPVISPFADTVTILSS